jgi:acetyl-CoA decarbonylase/synthase complex subunit gamma
VLYKKNILPDDPHGVRVRLSIDDEENRMALTGLQIQKLLPGTNCRECGSNTCLAFAMRLAAKKAELALCPYASEEAKRILGEANEPPVRTISLGREGRALAGGEIGRAHV